MRTTTITIKYLNLKLQQSHLKSLQLSNSPISNQSKHKSHNYASNLRQGLHWNWSKSMKKPRARTSAKKRFSQAASTSLDWVLTKLERSRRPPPTSSLRITFKLAGMSRSSSKIQVNQQIECQQWRSMKTKDWPTWTLKTFKYLSWMHIRAQYL